MWVFCVGLLFCGVLLGALSGFYSRLVGEEGVACLALVVFHSRET